jgi:sugar-specific transcriptional regulator TrmB
MLIEQELQKLGLNEKEARVYLALLDLGKSSAIAIADKAGVKRPTTYLVLSELARKGLVSVIPRVKKALYQAESPEKLSFLLESQRRVLKDIMPELLAHYKPGGLKPSVKFFSGTEGIKTVYYDTLKEGKEILAFLGVKEAEESLKEFFLKEYGPRRAAAKIFARVIAPKTPEAKEYQKQDKMFFRETRFIDSKIYPFSIEKNIYGNKVAIISHARKEQFGLIIISPEIVRTEKSIFEFIWSRIG